ncbi:MAG: Eco57I restriction-modification methylase domain-containing protein [Candidatus Cloacimonas sp.]|jgi:adenine-specific DNA-methyltransferase|nr:Eco57I restriction-modification methylase domain-containing protein [Candidatus Cloacimonas sp.]
MDQESTILLEALETQRNLHSNLTSVSHKSDFGQYFTPGEVAMFMAEMFPDAKGSDIRLLDPGAGIGGLACAFTLNMNERVEGLHYNIDCYEIDDKVFVKLANNLHDLSSFADVEYAVFHEDFIEKAVDHLLQFNKPKYTHVILNPPYKKMHSSSNHRKLLRLVDIEVVNLYSAFVSMSLELLQNDGYLVAIIPRSFCNGTYYLPFRKHILANAVIRRIHLFESRNSIFKNDSVLQENIIIMLQKSDTIDKVEVSYSKDQSVGNSISKHIDYQDIVDLNSWELIIKIPHETTNSFPIVETSFKQLGIMVSTGPVVDFRNREYINSETTDMSIPLIYPQNIHRFQVLWPSDKGLQASIILNSETKKQLYETGFYVVVRRFSSKEEKRRIVAGLVDPEDYKTGYLAFENHLNVFHNCGKGLETEIAYGLLVYLNSEGFDHEFRVFSGHTQVNVSDLKRMTYPSLSQLKELGVRLQKSKFNYQEFEDLIAEVINGNKQSS